MLRFRTFSRLKNIFSRLNPVSSFGLGRIKVKIEKQITFDEFLEKTIERDSNFEKVILMGLYHLINTQNVQIEFLSVLSKDLKLVLDLHEGDNLEVHLTDEAKIEGKNGNILVACHNHFFGAVVPSCEDILTTIKYNCKFTVITSCNHMGIIVNNFDSVDCEDLITDLKIFDKYLEFRFRVEKKNEIGELDSRNMSKKARKKLKLKLFDQMFLKIMLNL